MAHDFQVTIDTAHPHALADWWADALGWVVEPTDEAFLLRLIEQGHASEADTTRYQGALVWAVGAAILHPDAPERGLRRRVLFQKVPEPKVVKNRVHLDVRVPAEVFEAEVARVQASGATLLHRDQKGPSVWATLADPEGNEFCLTRWEAPTAAG